ncbi:MAG: hypothetical protein HY787_21065 [Deltaproteobacteria bacterium]|nr:hypothetical protein [Deltaproteobacteria bacterium]
MNSRIFKNSILVVIGLILFFSSISAWAYTMNECLGCHGQAGTATHTISMTEFKNSAHGKDLSCLDCHTKVKDESHQTRMGSGAVQCGQCHDQENRHGLEVNGRPRPQCHDCHTRHGILPKADPKSSVHPDRLPVTCKTCHPRECGGTDYWSQFLSLRVKSHKKQDFSRAFQDTNCVGCHQGKAAHGENPPINNQSCYKCHQPVQGKGPLWGSIHPRADWKRQPALFASAVADQAGLGLLAASVLLVIVRWLIQTIRRRR